MKLTSYDRAKNAVNDVLAWMDGGGLDELTLEQLIPLTSAEPENTLARARLRAEHMCQCILTCRYGWIHDALAHYRGSIPKGRQPTLDHSNLRASHNGTRFTWLLSDGDGLIAKLSASTGAITLINNGEQQDQKSSEGLI